MRVLEVIPSFEPLGGAENFVFNISLSLKSKDEVYVISLYDNKNKYVSDILEKNGIKIVYLSKKEGLDLRTAKLFDTELERIKPDIVHLHLNVILTCLPAIFARKSSFIYTFHTMISSQTYGNRNSPRNLLMRILVKHRFIFPVTISNTVDESFKQFFGDYQRKVIYNGINISRYFYKYKGLKKNTFISVGSFNDIKNNLFMIKCVEKLIGEGIDINYVILGSGKNYELCRGYCVQHNLDDRITLLGPVNNVEDYLAESSCLLLASHWEGNPLVINEAIASGVWVVANCVGGVKDLIDNTNGYLVMPENEDDFINKMKLFLENEKEIANFIVPENIERNRNKVDLNCTCIEYRELMNHLTERG